MDVTVTSLTKIDHPYMQCPNCHAAMKAGLEFYDGDGLFPPEISGWKSKAQYWAGILMCICSECDADLYALEIAVLSHPERGKEFFDDQRQSSGSVECKHVQASTWEWLIDRHIDVKFDDNAHHDYAGETMLSIDEHTIGLFLCAQDINKTQANAVKLFQLFLPYIKHIQEMKQVDG